ncbi:unnamed protein product [Pleuronectes platessa]|uniref:Uncharacterized protein n=1 Tax=Pleuronectes platessa TaxID=8262 RepID=A0A9N7VY50_PLEPL|nr:unnamed protein product [Pleuronectes platessa]
MEARLKSREEKQAFCPKRLDFEKLYWTHSSTFSPSEQDNGARGPPSTLPPSRSSSSSTTRSQAAGLQALTSPAADVSWQPGLCSPLRSQRRGKMLLSVPPRAGINPYSGYNSRNSKKDNASV